MTHLEFLRDRRRGLVEFESNLHELRSRAIWCLSEEVREALTAVIKVIETETALLRGQIRDELTWIAADEYIAGSSRP